MIVYRRAAQADAPAVVSLLEEIMEHHAVRPPERPRLASIVSSIIAASDHCFLLAETGEVEGEAADGDGDVSAHGSAGSDGTRRRTPGRIVGMCALLFSLSTWSAAPVCELQDLVVSADHRREDIGKGLIAAAENVARQRGCVRLFLLAEPWNLGALAFYRGLGLAEKTCLDFERDLTSGT